MSRQTARAALSLALAFVLLPLSPVQALLQQEGPSGVWSGAIEVPGQTLEITVVLQATNDGGWTGAIDIPAQNLTSFPLSDISVVGTAVSFAMAGAPGNPLFNGSWDASGTTIAGDFTQGGQTFSFSLALTAVAPETTVETTSPENAAMIAGSWSGNLSAGEQTLRIVFHIVAGGDGALTATMDSPDQGQTGLPINRVTFDGSVLHLELNYVGAAFEGTITADGTAIDGDWTQGDASLPLRVERR